MIEAISSSVANAQIARPAGTAADSGDVVSSNVEFSISEIPKAPYISPYVAVDTQANTAVIQIRDSDTGDVLRQFPSESAIKARQIAEEERARAESARQPLSQQLNEQPSTGVSNDIAVPTAEARQAIGAFSSANASTALTQTQQGNVDVTA